jgi:hypothetical protein
MCDVQHAFVHVMGMLQLTFPYSSRLTYKLILMFCFHNLTRHQFLSSQIHKIDHTAILPKSGEPLLTSVSGRFSLKLRRTRKSVDHQGVRRYPLHLHRFKFNRELVSVMNCVLCDVHMVHTSYRRRGSPSGKYAATTAQRTPRQHRR